MGLNIHLSDDYYLVSDSNEYALVKRKWNAKKEESYDQPCAHCGQMDTVLRVWGELKLKESDATTIEELAKTLKQIKNELQKIREAIQINS